MIVHANFTKYFIIGALILVYIPSITSFSLKKSFYTLTRINYFEAAWSKRRAFAFTHEYFIDNFEMPQFQIINEYRNNPRIIVDRKIYDQFSPIGELQSNETIQNKDGSTSHRYGTGILVSPCYIITNGHVVYGNDKEAIPGKDYSMTFRLGSSDKKAFFGSVTASVIKSEHRGGGADWAILKLKSCVGRLVEFGWFEPSDYINPQLVGRSIIVAGFLGKDARGELSVGIGKITGINRGSGLLMHSASMNYGSSGGAVLIRENGLLKLAGINTRQNVDPTLNEPTIFDYYTDNHANEFQNAGDILNSSEIKALLDADKNGSFNPNVDRVNHLVFGI